MGAGAGSFRRFYALDKEIFNDQSNQKIRNLQVLHETNQARHTASIYHDQNIKLEQTVAELEHTRHELQTALDEVHASAAEREHLLFQNEQQREIIHEMSVPVLPITSDILVMPLIGALDSARLRALQEQALQAIQRTSARALLIDITGVPIVDTQVAQGIIATMQAAHLLGTRVT